MQIIGIILSILIAMHPQQLCREQTTLPRLSQPAIIAPETIYTSPSKVKLIDEVKLDNRENKVELIRSFPDFDHINSPKIYVKEHGMYAFNYSYYKEIDTEEAKKYYDKYSLECILI